MREEPTYIGQEVVEVKNACGGGYNQLDVSTIRYLQRTFQDKFAQIFVFEDGTKIEGTVADIIIKESKDEGGK